MGWNRWPSRYGEARRYQGWNQVSRIDDDVLTTRPSARVAQQMGFTTRSGNSGGPALARLGEHVWVVGVLSGGWSRSKSGEAGGGSETDSDSDSETESDSESETETGSESLGRRRRVLESLGPLPKTLAG